MIKTDNTHTVKSLLPGFHDNSPNATTVDTVNIENEDNNNWCMKLTTGDEQSPSIKTDYSHTKSSLQGLTTWLTYYNSE